MEKQLATALTARGFNSKLVRLKGSTTTTRSGQQKCFNSKLVRLKVTPPPPSSPLPPSSFQFQTGAIKREGFTDAYAYTVCFNSKLVRLKGSYSAAEGEKVAGFNSKLVRLKGPKERTGYPTQKPRFNSKLVRLKDLGTRVGYRLTGFCFNSKLVRLKGMRAPALKFVDKEFQFQTGAIKSWKGGVAGDYMGSQFQFQTGAIKRST